MHSTTISAGIYSVTRLLYYMLDIVEVVLAFRFMLRLLGANADTQFVKAVYALSEPLVAPFRGVFSRVAVEGTVVEWSSLVAMIVYAIAAYALIRLITLLAKKSIVDQNVVDR